MSTSLLVSRLRAAAVRPASRQLFKQVPARRFGDDLKSSASESATKAKDTAQGAAAKATDLGKDAAAKATDLGKDAAAKASDTAKGAAESVKQTAKEQIKKGEDMKRWISDQGAWPVMGVIVFAVSFCTWTCTRFLVKYPDLRLTPDNRQRVLREELAELEAAEAKGKSKSK